MPVGSRTSPTLRRLSLTKPVSSCPILWTYFGRHGSVKGVKTPFRLRTDSEVLAALCRRAGCGTLWPCLQCSVTDLAPLDLDSAYPSALERFSGVPPRPSPSLEGGGRSLAQLG